MGKHIQCRELTDSELNKIGHTCSENSKPEPLNLMRCEDYNKKEDLFLDGSWQPIIEDYVTPKAT